MSLDYYSYLGIIERTFGHLNFILKNSGELREYSKTDLSGSKEIAKIKQIIDQPGRYKEKMKLICNLLKSDCNVTVDDLDWLPKNFKEPLEKLTLKEISGCSYEEKEIEGKLKELENIDNIGDELKKIFKPGERYSLSFINDRLKVLFETYHYTRPVMTSFIKRFFIVSKCKVNINFLEENKRVDGYKILKIK